MMKRIHTTMIIGLMAGVVMLAASCKREYGTVTLGANIAGGRDAKVYIDDLTPCWHNNDLIRVNNQTCTTSAALGSSAQIINVVESSHYRAIYPADIVGDVDISSSSSIAVTLPRVQQYEVDSRGDQKVKVPMGAYSTSESLTFHNLCPLIKVVVINRMDNDFILDHITVTAATSYLSGLCSASVTGSPNDHIGTMVPSSASQDVSLVFPVGNRPSIGRGDRDTYVYYIVAPEFGGDEGENVTITLYNTFGQYATFEKPGVSLRHNRMAQVSLTVEQWNGQPDPPSVDGVLPGAFSVSATQQVHFSQGNLQYQASTNTWRFAEHQYDYTGSDNSMVVDLGRIWDGWLDLFGWGTSGWNSGAGCYQPWSFSMSNSAYYPGGSYSNSLTGAYAEADWAYHNAISNGGNAAHLWRTLTSAEWDYLFNTRANASSKYGTGNIDGVGGLIILPDNWTLPSGYTFNSGFPSSDNWNHNSYTLAQWAVMEAAGAVFLPAAGSLWEPIPGSYEGGSGNYWSSTPLNENHAYHMNFCTYCLYATFGRNRYQGFSVRPVRVNN